MQVKVFSSFGEEGIREVNMEGYFQPGSVQPTPGSPTRQSLNSSLCRCVCFPVRVLLVNTVLQRYSNIFIHSLHIVNSN